MKDGNKTLENERQLMKEVDDRAEDRIDAITVLTEQYRQALHDYKERESLYLRTENQLKGTKQIVMEMSGTIRELKTQNDHFQAEIARLNEEIQLLELQIKK